MIAELVVSRLAPRIRSGIWRTHDEWGLALNVRGQVRRLDDLTRVTYLTFDEDGLRSTGRGARSGAPRVLVVGDSFAFGWRLDDGETVAARWQSLADAELGQGEFA